MTSSASPASASSRSRRLLIDARGCGVKAEIYRMAGRYGLRAVLVSETEIGAPFEPWLTKIITGSGTIPTLLENEVGALDILVTDDTDLAARVWTRCACVLNTRGQRWTADGPSPPLTAKAKGNPRTRFVSVLEDEIVALLKNPAPPSSPG